MTTTTQAARFTFDGETGPHNGRNLGETKEITQAISVVAVLPDGRLTEPVVARIYMSRSASASRVYATIWVRGARHCSGHGHASGYGYHKPSAALDSAIRSAGIELSQPIDGRGDYVMTEALEAIARACGFTGELLTVRHG